MSGSFLPVADRDVLEAISRITYCNPFLPERYQLEREILGSGFQEPDAEARGLRSFSTNLGRLHEVTQAVVERARLAFYQARGNVDKTEFAIYQDVVHFALFSSNREPFLEFIRKAYTLGNASRACSFYKDFESEYNRYFPLRPEMPEPQYGAPHIFAMFFQIRRAFYHIFEFIIGTSPAANRLRARIWQSIFTHDMARYQRSLFNRIGDIVTFITGPSGSGKELVARAIGLSRFIPFDADRLQFEEDFLNSFIPVNLSALTETLLESELFGHRKGSFTGALQDRKGYLETCGQYGTILLDEITETRPDIQVKLLRVLQTRQFQRLGDTRSLPFQGKFMAASNCDLAEEMREGRFREDFYYRLCADRVETLALREILHEDPEELHHLVHFIAGRIAGSDEADGLTEEACKWIRGNLGLGYPWPGNFRELEQCVRNVMVHSEYMPESTQANLPRAKLLTSALGAGTLTAEKFLSEYIASVYEKTQNYNETARLLELDRRTVKKYVDLADTEAEGE